MARVSEWQIIERRRVPVLSIRSKITLKELQSEMDEAREKLTAYLEHIDEFPAGPFYVIYHSFSPEEVDMEAGIPVHQQIEGQEEIEPGEKRAGLFLTCYHQGSYRSIPRVYREIEEWLEEHSYEMTGASEEIYLNHDVPESQLLTQVLVPIQRHTE
ncbi:GyrI-like domain-containing protein [Jeotgalibaca caeni]|uniref:GyrI-like domain-containing protein n=1 Tax=Jeotgalibaca caeni TaxID=3028623 RepID=UPI00237D7BDE|nr:GyrI-like domain-containing protein [Jeotgalibaca caeni]MDE1549896.1 GyrI-like domain-containing protein [Jeotgalibaca caeni]